MTSLELFHQEFLRWLREDNPYWDLTTHAVIPDDAEAIATIECKSEWCIAACTEEVAYSLERLGLAVETLVDSGFRVQRGGVVLEFSGEARLILEVERVVLNTLIYASSIATYTRMLVDMVRRVNPRVRVAATRKTVPGFRYCSKRAVEAGGGDTHRLGLSDAILVKDNHVAIVGSVRAAVRAARARKSYVHRVIVEVHDVKEALEAVEAGADAILIDNQDPVTVQAIIEALETRGLRDRVIIEVSGGIDESNIIEYARLPIDVISVGRLTMPPVRVDMSMKVMRLEPIE